MSDQPDIQTITPGESAASFDAVIVGAGFSGMYMLHKLRELGFRARVYEAGSGVGVYRQKCDDLAEKNYEGFDLRR